MSIKDIFTEEGQRFYAELAQLEKLEVRIGYQAGKVVADNDVDMVDVAMWNELGTIRSPSRPFLRQTLDEHTDEIQAFCAAQASKIADGGSAEACLKAIGVYVKGLVQEQILSGSFEPNAPSTVAKKGSDHPLIDSGLMRRTVDYVIEPKGGD